jgi:hypothetical protein
MKGFSWKYWFIPVALIGIVVVGLMIISLYSQQEVLIPGEEKIVPPTEETVTKKPMSKLAEKLCSEPDDPHMVDLCQEQLEKERLLSESREVTGKTWVKTFGGYASLVSAQPTTDGGGVVLWAHAAGKTPYGDPFSVEYISKANSDGNIVWNRTFLIGWIGSVQETSDGGYIMSGSIAKWKDGSDIVVGDFSKLNREAGDTDVYLIKTDSDGNTLWKRTIDLGNGDECDGASSVMQTSDGYMIAGTTTTGNCYGNRISFLLKTDADGNKLFEKTVTFEGEPLRDTIVLQRDSDGGYMIAGFIEMNSTGAPREMRLIKTDANGNKIWERAYDKEFPGEGGRMISFHQTSDSAYMIIGTPSGEFVHFLKTDADGNVLEKKELRLSTIGTAFCDNQPIWRPIPPTGPVKQTSDGGYIIVKEGACLIKTDADGNIIWKNAGVVGTDFRVEEPLVWQTPDNGYMIVGKMYYGLTAGEIGQGMYSDIIMIKTDKNGNVQYEPIPARFPTSPAVPSTEKVVVTGKGWNKTFEGDFNSRANSVQQTSDGGYIAAGWMGHGVIYPSGWNDTLVMEQAAIYLLKTDASGNKVWGKSFGGLSMSACSNYDNIICDLNWNNTSGWLTETVGHSVQQTSDGGYIITGAYHTGKLHNRTSPTDYQHFEFDKGDEVYFIKTDANGNMIWNKTFGEYYDEIGYSVQQTSDGGYIIVGSTRSYGVCPYCTKELGQSAPEDIYLIKTDSDGNKLWDKVIGGMYMDIGYSVQQTSDGGYVISGVTSSLSGNGVEDVYLLKMDTNGNKLWEKTFGRNDRSEAGYSVQQTSDSGYVIVGETVWSGTSTLSIASGGNPRSSDVYLMKTDANGNELWEKEFGGDQKDSGYSVQQTSDGGYIIAGMAGSFGAALTPVSTYAHVQSMYLIKTDSNGNKIWQTTFKSTGATSVQQTSDGGYIVAGGKQPADRVQREGYTPEDAYLIKTDENGNV